MLIEERVVKILQTSTKLCVNRFSYIIFFYKLLFYRSVSSPSLQTSIKEKDNIKLKMTFSCTPQRRTSQDGFSSLSGKTRDYTGRGETELKLRALDNIL